MREEKDLPAPPPLSTYQPHPAAEYDAFADEIISFMAETLELPKDFLESRRERLFQRLLKLVKGK